MPAEHGARTRTVGRPAPPDVAEVAGRIAEWGGTSVVGLVFFGSHRTGAAPDPWSALDFFVAVEGYRDFYRALRGAGRVRRSPVLLSVLNAVLPPNQIAIRLDDERVAKCAVVTLAVLERETGPRRRDHFCAGRLFQPVAVAWARDAAARSALEGVLDAALRSTFAWLRPWLPARFGAGDYAQTALRVSMSWEIRPEPSGRADALWEAQRAELEPACAGLLGDLAAAGELEPATPGTYRVARPVRAIERWRLHAYFQVSRARATLRWFKYVCTFEGWLDYILRKARRHTGQDIALTPGERRFPLLLLWPRVWRYLRDKDRPAGPPGTPGRDDR